MRPHSVIHVGLAILLVAGCDVFTGPADRVDITLAVSRDTLLIQADTLAIRVRVMNPTADTLRFDGGGCLLQFEIRDKAGDVVAPELLACPAILRHVRLAPGDTLNATFGWYGERWTSRVSPPPPELLPAGTYQVYGILDAIGDRQRTDARTVILVQSATEE